MTFTAPAVLVDENCQEIRYIIVWGKSSKKKTGKSRVIAHYGARLQGSYGSCIHQVQSKMADKADEGLSSENSLLRDSHSNYIYSHNSNTQSPNMVATFFT